MKHKVLFVAFILFLLCARVSVANAAPLVAEGTVDGLDSLGEIVGALGLFTAMMAVLALGTEVLVDSIKFFVGLKSKPSTLDALVQFGDKLPGQLRDLGLSDAEIQKVKDVTQNLQLELKPVQQVNEAALAILAAREGDLQGAFEKLKRLFETSDSVVLKQLRTELETHFDEGLTKILERLNLDPSPILKVVKQQIQQVTSDITLEGAASLLMCLQNQALVITQAWLKGQEQTLFQSGREAVLSLFRDEVVPEFKMLGLDDPAIDIIYTHLEDTLSFASNEVTVHLEATRELMQAVADRRNAIQSPERKAWRKLRTYKYLGYGFKFPWWVDDPWIGPLKTPGFPEGVGLLTWPEAVFNWLLRRQPKGKTRVGEIERIPPLTPTTLAGRLLADDNQHRDEEKSRVRIMRILSVITGVYLAYRLQVDAIAILAGAADTFEELWKINDVVNTHAVLSWLNPKWLLTLLRRDVLVALPPGWKLNAGILLSGLAASAGSAFWHEQLERLQVFSEGVERVKQIVTAANVSQEK